ncbi:hypothetical protein B0H14DRAFT_3148202 [Mycena olivaceomarginata]|nr:hypothetical protein B0H14DRAFT_3148202 [Mycena olivaceomarginata]
MVWHGDIIENSKISADYAEWNSAHPFCIRQNRESFVLYTDDPNDCGTAYHACDLQVAILHNRLLHNPDRDINYNPAVYPKLVEHLNHYDAVRWAVYHPVDDCISWPSPITSGELSLPTLQEFMVRDSDVFVTTLPKGKVIVDEEFQKRGIALILEADSRRSRAIETSKEKVAIRRAGDFEGKLSPEERAKLAAKVASSRAEYVKRVGKKTATPANPQGEGDSGAGGAGGAAGPSIAMEDQIRHPSCVGTRILRFRHSTRPVRHELERMTAKRSCRARMRRAETRRDRSWARKYCTRRRANCSEALVLRWEKRQAIWL